MFGLFKRKKKEVKPICKHHWELSDVYGLYIDNGCNVDFEDRFVLYCNCCQIKKTVDEYDYRTMTKYGLVKNLQNK